MKIMDNADKIHSLNPNYLYLLEKMKKETAKIINLKIKLQEIKLRNLRDEKTVRKSIFRELNMLLIL